MQKFITRYIVLIVILIIFSFLIVWVQFNQPQQKTSIDISKLPLDIGEWRGAEIPVDIQTKNILETDAVLMRRYINLNGDEIVLAMVYYKDSRVALHLPESCLLGHGSRLVNREKEKIEIPNKKNFYATKLEVKNDFGDNLVIYYFETGGQRTNSYFIFRKQLLINKLKGHSTSGALVRFSTDVKRGNSQSDLNTLKRFISEVGVLLPKYLF